MPKAPLTCTYARVVPKDELPAREAAPPRCTTWCTFARARIPLSTSIRTLCIGATIGGRNAGPDAPRSMSSAMVATIHAAVTKAHRPAPPFIPRATRRRSCATRLLPRRRFSWNAPLLCARRPRTSTLSRLPSPTRHDRDTHRRDRPLDSGPVTSASPIVRVGCPCRRRPLCPHRRGFTSMTSSSVSHETSQ